MHKIGLIIAVILVGLYTYLGETTFTIDGTQLPPIVKFMNPYTGFWANAVPINNSEVKKEFNLSELSSEGTVVFDQYAVPHIYADNALDVYRLQGYVHASERLWQMDMISRAAGGMLAEILGKSALQHDIHQRKAGMLYAAENALEEIKKNEKAIAFLNAYCEGVNAYVNGLDASEYPLEYKLMNFEPREWKPIDIMLIFKQMAYDLCYIHYDMESTLTRQYMGAAKYDSLFTTMLDRTYPVIPAQDYWTPRDIPIMPDSIIYKVPFSFEKQYKAAHIDKDNGSNNWAVSGAITTTGTPILANDPHLGLSLPSIWYENHLNTDKMNVYGVSIPGVPSVVIGFNDHIAWGLTNVGQDVADWRKLDWQDKDFDSYILDSTIHKTILRKEKIAIKGSDTLVLPIYLTEAGIVSYTQDTTDVRYGLAFYWLAHHEPAGANELIAIHNLNIAHNLAEYRAAIALFGSPAQNFVFASTEGDIALTVQGRFPIKAADAGKYVQKFTDSDQLYTNFIPSDKLPHQINPERNYVASANQVSTASGYPYYYNSTIFEHFRNRYMNSYLDTASNLSIQDIEALQLSNYSKEAELALNVLLPILENVELNAEAKPLIKQLKDWNYEFDKDSQVAVLYSLFIDHLMHNAWDEFNVEVDQDILRYPGIYKTIRLLEADTSFSYLLHKTDGSTYPSKLKLVKQSFLAACKDYNQQLKADSELKWADYKGTRIMHLAGIPAFSSDTLYSGGHDSALNAQKEHHGPSWRMVVSLSTPVKAYGVYPGGQSGNPGSPYYDNMIADWVNGEYHLLQHPQDPSNIAEPIKKWTFE